MWSPIPSQWLTVFSGNSLTLKTSHAYSLLGKRPKQLLLFSENAAVKDIDPAPVIPTKRSCLSSTASQPKNKPSAPLRLCLPLATQYPVHPVYPANPVHPGKTSPRTST